MNTDALLTIVFGVACAVGGGSLIMMLLAAPRVVVADRSQGGKRVDQSRGDQIQQLVADTQLLLAHYKFRNRLIVLVFSVLIAVNALGLKSTDHTSMQAKSAANQANAAITQLNVVAKESRRVSKESRHVATRSRNAICRFVSDLKDRKDDQRRKVERTEMFLRDHPAGIPGVPIALLRQGLRTDKVTLKNQRATIKSFASLKCQPRQQ